LAYGLERAALTASALGLDAHPIPMREVHCLNGKPILEVKGISKSFPGVQALKDVDLDIYPGEVHGVVGENGAGKSTLMKILTGVLKKDEGEYFFEGQKVSLSNIQQSIQMGVSCIYQELSIVPLLDVAKNIYLGNFPCKNGFVDQKKLYGDAQQVLKQLDMDISPKTLANKLSVAQHQMLEIGRAISRNSKVIIMDEPTSSLTSKETETLFTVIRKLKEKGVAIFYISHKLEEIMEITDRVTVFRDGRKIASMQTSQTDMSTIVHHMIGRTIENYYNKVQAKFGDIVLEAKGLTRAGYFEDVNFSIRSGEVLGFFGLVGAGRSEIMKGLFGVDPLDNGSVRIGGRPVKIHNPQMAIKHGIGHVPEDRKQEGLVQKMDVKSNVTLVKISEINHFGLIDQKAELDFAQRFVDYLEIKTPSMKKLTGELSGGNQQKVVISRWLMMHPKVLILDEPTRGVDVGSKSEIYRLISDLAGQGVAVIVISSELPEIIGLSDRIITVCNGKISGEITSDQFDSHTIMRYALGGVGA